jgi:hypothetical protein
LEDIRHVVDGLRTRLVCCFATPFIDLSIHKFITQIPSVAVIPAKAGIQSIKKRHTMGQRTRYDFVRYAERLVYLNSGLRRNDVVADYTCCRQFNYGNLNNCSCGTSHACTGSPKSAFITQVLQKITQSQQMIINYGGTDTTKHTPAMPHIALFAAHALE